MSDADIMARLRQTITAGQKFPLETVGADDMAALEKAVGRKLPSSYRDIVTGFGIGDVPYARTYAPGAMLEIWQNDDVLRTRQYLPFGDDYSGQYYCFDFSRPAAGDEYQVLSLLNYGEYEVDFDSESFPAFVDKIMKIMGDWQ